MKDQLLSIGLQINEQIIRYKTLDEYQGPEEGLPGSSGGRNPLFDDEDDA